MHNTDTSIKENMVPDKEDAVQHHVSDTSTLPSERPVTSIISGYEVSVFRDVEAAVTAAADIVCNSGLDIGDVVVEHNATKDEYEIIAYFLKGGCLCKLLDGTLCSTQFIALILQEACDECRQLAQEQACHGCYGSVSGQLQFRAL